MQKPSWRQKTFTIRRSPDQKQMARYESYCTFCEEIWRIVPADFETWLRVNATLWEF